MRKSILLSLLLLELLNSCYKVDSNKNLESCYSNTNAQSIFHNGTIREYVLYIPDSYDGASTVPLMLNFHGFGDSASNYIINADMRAIAESETFILVNPQGSCSENSSHWNPCPIGGDNKSSADDLGFINRLLTSLPGRINIDNSRIYACGYSNGGFFSYALACNLNDQIAAIGSVAGTMVSDTYVSCQASVPTPMINIHGAKDPIVPYRGSAGLISIDNVLDFWSELNYAKNLETDFFEGVENYIYKDSLGTPFVSHFKIINGSHTWDYNSLLSNNTSTNELIWEFVSKFDINGYIK